MIIIPTGTFLYSGCNVSLNLQDGYWFAFDRETANQYNGGHMVVKYRVKHPLRVYDILSEKFQTLCADMEDSVRAPFGYPDCIAVQNCLDRMNVSYPCIFQSNEHKLFSKFYGQYAYDGVPWIAYVTKKLKRIEGVGIVWPVRTENVVLQLRFEREICLFDTREIEYIDTYTMPVAETRESVPIDGVHISDSVYLPGCPASPHRS